MDGAEYKHRADGSILHRLTEPHSLSLINQNETEGSTKGKGTGYNPAAQPPLQPFCTQAAKHPYCHFERSLEISLDYATSSLLTENPPAVGLI